MRGRSEFAPDDRFRFEYEMIRSYRFPTVYPPDLSHVKDVVDFHMHVGAGRIDPIAQTKHASEAGMRAIVFKESAMPSVEIARITNEVVAEWAEGRGFRPTECFGGIVLDKPLGGINVGALKMALRHGAKVVWMPVLQSAHHLATAFQLPKAQAKAQGVSVLDANGKLSDAVREVIELAAEHDAILSCGHQSPREILALAEEMQRVNFKKGVVDHPLHPLMCLSRNDINALADQGLYLNLTYAEMSQFVGVSPLHFRDIIRDVGVKQVVVSSDAGSGVFPDSVECMRIMKFTFGALGLSDSEMGMMMKSTSCKLLGIEGNQQN